MHHSNGIDIRAPFGSKVKAVRSGKVIYSGYEAGYGNVVIIYHGRGISTVYAHASKLLSMKGMRVQKGETSDGDPSPFGLRMTFFHSF